MSMQNATTLKIDGILTKKKSPNSRLSIRTFIFAAFSLHLTNPADWGFKLMEDGSLSDGWIHHESILCAALMIEWHENEKCLDRRAS